MADCPIPANGDVIRITRTDNCGRPVEGPDNAFVDECVATVGATPQFDEGTEIIRRGMNGKLCGYRPACPALLGYDVSLALQHTSPKMVELLLAQTPILDMNDEVVGWAECDVKCDQGVGLELWQEVLGVPCPEDAEGLWFYWLYPWVTNLRQDGEVTVGDGSDFSFNITGRSRLDSGWCQGPWDVVMNPGEPPAPGPLLTPILELCNGFRYPQFTTVAPPTPDCDYIEVPANNCSTA